MVKWVHYFGVNLGNAMRLLNSVCLWMPSRYICYTIHLSYHILVYPLLKYDDDNEQQEIFLGKQSEVLASPGNTLAIEDRCITLQVIPSQTLSDWNLEVC
jgi:hypothetical protein